MGDFLKVLYYIYTHTYIYLVGGLVGRVHVAFCVEFVDVCAIVWMVGWWTAIDWCTHRGS